MSPDELAKALARPGRVSIPYLDRYSPDGPLVLERFRPRGHDPDKPVLMVQHGASRNGAEYCQAWTFSARNAPFPRGLSRLNIAGKNYRAGLVHEDERVDCRRRPGGA